MMMETKHMNSNIPARSNWSLPSAQMHSEAEQFSVSS